MASLIPLKREGSDDSFTLSWLLVDSTIGDPVPEWSDDLEQELIQKLQDNPFSIDLIAAYFFNISPGVWLIEFCYKYMSFYFKFTTDNFIRQTMSYDQFDGKIMNNFKEIALAWELSQ